MRKRGRKRSQSTLESIGMIVGEVLTKGKLGGGTRVAELWHGWTEIVGKDIAAHCFPEKMERGKLYIKADSPIWCQQIDLLKEELKEKIESKLKNCDIQKIVVRSTTSSR